LRALCRIPGARLGALRSQIYSLKAEFLVSLGYGQTGQWGERVAALHIRRGGALVLRQNWLAGNLEADIIALDTRTLVVVEVKTRHESLMHTFPARQAVTTKKTAHLSALARAFMRQNGPFCRRFGIKAYRIDTIEVYYRRTYFQRHRTHCVSWHKNYIASS
jgi:putative endonuclease